MGAHWFLSVPAPRCWTLLLIAGQRPSGVSLGGVKLELYQSSRAQLTARALSSCAQICGSMPTRKPRRPPLIKI